MTASQKEALRWQSITGYNEALSAARRLAARNGSVKTGLDVLEEHGFDVLKMAGRKKRIGVVTNQTGRDRTGHSTIDLLFKAPNVKLVALFSPEHGIRGLADEKVSDTKDEQTGLPIYSLYGESRRPKPEQLKDLDALVYDIQDVGARFYTYITTLGYAMEEAAKAKLPLFVLDRPNPINGVDVEALAVRAKLTQPHQSRIQASLKLLGIAGVEGLYAGEAN